MTPATAPTHSLALWADGRQVATLGYEPLNDRWSLDYDDDWVDTPEAFHCRLRCRSCLPWQATPPVP